MEANIAFLGCDAPIETEKTGKMRNIARPYYGLSGHSFVLAADDGYEYHLSFLSGDSLTLGRCGEEERLFGYLCIRASAEVWLVNFLNDGSCVSVVFDTKNSLTTIVFAYSGAYPKRPKLLKHEVLFGAIKRPGVPLSQERHGYTLELVGKKIAWKYSPVVTITHIYVSAHAIRSSLKNMEPLPPEATPEQREECVDRARRWSRLFFEEPCCFIKIDDGLYLVTFIEDNRNRADQAHGGGDMLLLVDTMRVRDVGRTFGVETGGPHMKLITAYGRFVNKYDEMEDAQSPYWV